MKCPRCNSDRIAMIKTTAIPEYICRNCEASLSVQPESLPEKLARLIRENPGMPVTVCEICKGVEYYHTIKKVTTMGEGSIVITIGTP